MRRWFWILDAGIVLSFVLIGRDTHGFIPDVGDTIRVAAPFLLALVVAIFAFRAWTHPTSWRTGLALGTTTLVVGMLLRRFVFDAGTARTFVILTAAWFIGLMVGWRLAWSLVSRLRRRRTESN
jgi:hypothetical protein